MSSNTFRGTNNNLLTKYPAASLRELLLLSFPLVLSAISASLLGICDRYFLSHYSLEAWKACSIASNLCFFYQMTLIMFAVAAQAFIGHFQGANKQRLIGPLAWQMIYFSLFSMVITYPLSLVTELYLNGTEIQAPATFYFRALSLANFLFPLGATLAAFYIGRGKTRVILLVNLLIQVINIGLDYLLIFGIEGWFAPMGIKGAAIASIAAQSLLCFILFLMFLQKKYIPLFRTDLRKFNRSLLWEVLKTGIPRALGRAFGVGSWIIASYLMIQRGGDYLLIHTFGVSLFLILTFMQEGMGQALVTVCSHILGAKLDNVFRKLIKSSLLFHAITMVILAIPLLFMQEALINFFIKDKLSPTSIALLKDTCFWIWILCFTNGINRIGVSFMTASRDTLFYARWCSIPLITRCIPVFLGIGYLGWSPTMFFVIDGLNGFGLGVIFISRFLKDPFRRINRSSLRFPEEMIPEQALTTD